MNSPHSRPQAANELMGGRSGSMMWPGGEFAYGNRSCTYATSYKPGAEPRDKVDTVMRWLTSVDQPANLVMLYFDEPDLMGHVYSPASQVVSVGVGVCCGRDL